VWAIESYTGSWPFSGGGFHPAAFLGGWQAGTFVMLMLNLMMMHRHPPIRMTTLIIWVNVCIALIRDSVCQTTNVCGATLIANAIVDETGASAQSQTCAISKLIQLPD